ncbi:type II methionyl aminopeptidase [Methanothermococcus okinawensis]|uniref:Methionine aminopeptidase n=1 Tax=Methanothermococcus okinawensis (strain DSM 14208 / JCM 11175 / IH1) TaxID=647113 RepID=F8ANH9_METOI|nr:type II methionyl aminopeptidase [Methanothermococcus okinawensis]AEH07033.1 methionine aminopeptidase, type II [Methanothermococcus okinawensis IH1]
MDKNINNNADEDSLNEESEMVKKLMKAGEIHAEVIEEAEKLIKPGAKLYDVAEYVENRTRELGGEVAFPCNISINDIAAHYTPVYKDEKTFSENDVVKLDIGVHVDGYIADGARTIDLSCSYNDLKKASEDALYTVIKEIVPPMNIGDMGAIIQEVIESYGYKPVSNLSGHVMEQYVLHSGISIPNVKEKSKDYIDVGDIVAIEPFATDGYGEVMDGNEKYIFKYIKSRPVRLPSARKILKIIEKKYPYLPFAGRWLATEDSKYKIALRTLMSSGCLYGYSTLIEKNHGMVSQTEHTVLITENGAKITTKR